MSAEHVLRLNATRRSVEATDVNMAGSSFVNVNLSNAVFDDVNLSNAVFDDVNLTDAKIRNVNLTALQINHGNLSNAAIVNCRTEGMTIDGIPVADLLAAYRASRSTDN